MTPTGLDQLWVADITYIRLRADFVYLAVILDAFSRQVIGWALGQHAGGHADVAGLAHGVAAAAARAGVSASLRLWRAVCFR